MTFEEFRKLALNPPYNYDPSVYRVDVFRIQGTDNGNSCLTIYPEDNLRECFSRIDYILEQSDENEHEYYPEYKVCKAQSFLEMRKALSIPKKYQKTIIGRYTAFIYMSCRSAKM